MEDDGVGRWSQAGAARSGRLRQLGKKQRAQTRGGVWALSSAQE